MKRTYPPGLGIERITEKERVDGQITVNMDRIMRNAILANKAVGRLKKTVEEGLDLGWVSLHERKEKGKNGFIVGRVLFLSDTLNDGKNGLHKDIFWKIGIQPRLVSQIGWDVYQGRCRIQRTRIVGNACWSNWTNNSNTEEEKLEMGMQLPISGKVRTATSCSRRDWEERVLQKRWSSSWVWIGLDVCWSMVGMDGIVTSLIES